MRCLTYLHTRAKPVIYRDIKAENIIVTGDNEIKLVDFDISREYDEAADSDTVYYGTKEYSPPEQFGYSQTNARADIYSLGVLMLFMLTGSKDKGKVYEIKDMLFQRIISKCLSFAPKERYASASALKIALKRTGRAPKTMRARSVAVLTAAGLLLGVLLGIGLEHQGIVLTFTSTENKQVMFESALIEKAVRLQLGKNQNEPIYQPELLKIESLNICGDQVYDGSQQLLLQYLPGFTNVELCFDSYGNAGERVTRGA